MKNNNCNNVLDQAIAVKKVPYSLVLGILSVSLFVVGHITGSSNLLFLGLGAMTFNFLMFSDDLLGLQLLYIPLVTILKLSPDGASLLSFVSLIGVFVFFTKQKVFSIDITSVCIFLGLLFLLLFKEIFLQFGVTMVYARLLITIVTTALFVRVKINDSHIAATEMRRANLFLTCGVILASLIGYFFADNVNLAQFLTVEAKYVDGELVDRFCGVSADPNYYSSLVIFAISSNLFQFVYKHKISNIFFTIVLSIFGLLSLSKMFLMLLAIVLLVFLFVWARTNKLKNGNNMLGIIGIGIGILLSFYFILNSTPVQLILARIGGSNTLNEFTTGRSDTWLEYIYSITGNIEYFFLGVRSNSSLAGLHNTHNTLLQIWWKLGIVGVVLIFTWFVSMWNKCKSKHISGSLLLLIGCIGATIALDMLFFEQLFWFFIFCVICRHVSNVERKKI